MTDIFPGDEPAKHLDTVIPPPRLTFEGPKAPLFKALAEARKHFLSLSTDSQADVKNKEGKFLYSFKYAPLDVVLAAIEPGLQAAGIALLQPFDGDVMYTILAVGDSMLTVETPLPNWSSPQDLGSLLTYLRRYQLKGIFGVADSEDDDGNQASGNKAEVTRKPATTKANGPAIPKELALKVTAAAKANELGQAEFYALVEKQVGKPWGECDVADAENVLSVLGGK